MSNSSLFEAFRVRFPSADTSVITLRGGRCYSYGDLDALSGRFAHVLANRGVRPGDRVAVQTAKSPEAVFLYLATLRAGAVFLPLNTAYRADELDYFLADAAPAVVVGDPSALALPGLCEKHGIGNWLTLDETGAGSLMDEARALPVSFAPIPRAARDLAAILYSSGTTGRPKGVMMSHGNLLANAAALHEAWAFEAADTLLHVLPIFHTHGLFVAVNLVLFNGSGMIFHAKFTVEDVIADLRHASVFMGVPTYYARLASHPALTPDLCRNTRLFISGSAPLQQETFEIFARRSGKQILERYGMTEAGIITSARLDKPRQAGQIGWPLPGVALRIADGKDEELPPGNTGEIQFKSPGLFQGYWQKPEKTDESFTQDGFFRTGDLAHRTADGMVHIVGRLKDMFISGGFNVYPKEIEAVLDSVPGVAESAVVGMPHPDFGEAGLAVIATTPGAAALDPIALRDVLKAALANYKLPKLIVFAESLPRNAMGKVQKTLLQFTYQARWRMYLRSPHDRSNVALNGE